MNVSLKFAFLIFIEIITIWPDITFINKAKSIFLLLKQRNLIFFFGNIFSIEIISVFARNIKSES